ncbi:MAG: HPr family phosphocarrier protein [Verrucomicrobia bacterium]|jgi:phosphocarrier protein HPr|nr:HPr family phosphocarrier protein [Verrucomicrobiota bacterium]
MSGTKKADSIRITKELIVLNKLGIHARPAALFVKTANRFDCDVFVEKDGEKVNGKSIMGLMMLAAGPGSRLLIEADGHDAAKAVVEIELLIKRKFDEE